MLEPLHVRLSTTYFRLVLPYFHPAYTFIKQFLDSRVTLWDFNPRTGRSVMGPTFYTHNLNSGILRIPRGYWKPFQMAMEKANIPLDVQPETLIVPRPISLSILPNWEPRPAQVAPIQFLSNKEPGQRGLELETGIGKTIISIFSIVNHGCAAMVVCSGLIDQWVKVFHDVTGTDDIYVIKTFKSVADLIKSEHLPSIMVCSLETLRLYSRATPEYKELPFTYDGFLQHYGIGIKIVDEVHENFHAIAIMDLFSRVPCNVYMSATFRRANAGENRLFNHLYPYDIRYNGGEVSRHTNVTFYNFASGVPERRTVNQYGYNHSRFEGYLLKRVTKFNAFMDAVRMGLETHFLKIRRPKEKALIYFATIQMCQQALAYFKEKYPKLTINTYISTDTPEKYADGVDVIISIPAKSATGRDIKGLRTVINTVSTQSNVLIEQMVGRLRPLIDAITEFVSFFDAANQSHVRHNLAQRKICNEHACTCSTYNV